MSPATEGLDHLRLGVPLRGGSAFATDEVFDEARDLLALTPEIEEVAGAWDTRAPVLDLRSTEAIHQLRQRRDVGLVPRRVAGQAPEPSVVA
jgi:hypothetical protein